MNTEVLEKKETKSEEALHAIAELCHKRSLVIIFSDLLDDPDKTDALFESLQHLKHNKHEVILFHVTDKKNEIDFNLGIVRNSTTKSCFFIYYSYVQKSQSR